MKLRAWSGTAAFATFLLMVVGAYVVKIGAGLSCPDWPTCNGSYLPPTDLFTFSEWFHRFLAMVVSVLTAGTIVAAWRRYRDHGPILTLAVIAGGLLFAQILMGAATVRLGNAPWTVVIHQGLAIGFFGVLIALTTLSWGRDASPFPKEEPATPHAARVTPTTTPKAEARSWLRVLGDYVQLLKPRVLMLLLIAAVTSMLIAAGDNLSPWTIIATIVGGAMASGAGSAFNQWWERDLDAMMARTAQRPVASGRLSGPHVLAFSASLALGSFMILAVFANLLAALLALGGALFYVTVYTIWLKRSRPSNIVIGGAAGSFPVLVGWAAATGHVTLPALVLGFIIFLWTPPHFWAFALLYKNDYARAGVPMLPVVRGDDETKQQIFLYTVALLVCSTSLWLFGVLSVVYLLVAMVLGAAFVFLAFDLLRHPGTQGALRLFRYSILYLGLLFLYMAVDKLWVEAWLQ